MPNNYTIVVTLGHRYQVIRVDDNTPVGSSYATKADAEEGIRRIDAEEYGWDWQPSSIGYGIEREVSARTVQSLGAPSETSGVSDKSRHKRTTPAKELP